MEKEKESLGESQSADAKLLFENIFQELVTLTKLSNSLPSAQELRIQTSMDSTLAKRMKEEATEVHQMIIKLVEFVHQNVECKALKHKNSSKYLLKNYDALGEIIDLLLEDSNKKIDQIAGFTTQMEIKKKPKFPHHENMSKEQQIRATTLNIPKPQEKFMDCIDNSHLPFIPKIQNKFYKMVDLSERYKEIVQIVQQNPALKRIEFKPSTEILEFNEKYFSIEHPYEYEINNFSNPEHLITEYIPDLGIKTLEQVPFHYIDTLEDYKSLISKLEKSKEIAIDLEHHHVRSYQGILCLMQISTRDEDFVVDLLKIWKNVPLINPILANSQIVKVFHGADHDIKWLQRDFSSYIVNLFDTGQAATVLGLQFKGLGFLLKEYCKMDADKKYQLSDWRERPLSKEMLKYAREDTHYLLYIYDTMRRQLIARAIAKGYTDHLKFLKMVLQESKSICLLQYQKPSIKDNEYYVKINSRENLSNTAYNKQKMSILKIIYKWKDYVGRLEDENRDFVLSRRLMYRMQNEFPTNHFQFKEFFNKHNKGTIPPLINKYKDSLLFHINRKIQKYSEEMHQSYEYNNMLSPNKKKKLEEKNKIVKNKEFMKKYSEAQHSISFSQIEYQPLLFTQDQKSQAPSADVKFNPSIFYKTLLNSEITIKSLPSHSSQNINTEKSQKMEEGINEMKDDNNEFDDDEIIYAISPKKRKREKKKKKNKNQN